MTKWERFMLQAIFLMEIGRLIGMAAAVHRWW
jgi:hypothetical protein